MPVAALRWDEVVLDRTNHHWRELTSLAKLLLGGRFQTTTSGEAEGFSLLFAMNTLFEKYVARMLVRALKSPLRVEPQRPLHCLEELDGDRGLRFQVIPDILIKRGPETLLVIDTKWKQLKGRSVDPKQDVSQADIYQMLAYSRIYCCSRLMLLYPHHAELGGTDHVTTRYRVIGSVDSELAISTIDIGLAEGMTERLGELVKRQLPHPSDLEAA
ncbi:MAG: McrC family protein [Pseudomonadota bacterium]|nr:McrC family protein [Pseudomonadota bacterium]